MPQLFTNSARALLIAGIDASATSLIIESSKADFFPVANAGAGSVPSANNWFKAVLQDALGNIEIVYVRTRTSGSGVFSNVLRAQEGTTARAFIAGAVVGVRLTAADINSAVDLVSKNNAFTGLNTFSGASTFIGNITSSGANTFSGVNTFSQTIVGSISGNAATVTNGVYTTGNQNIAGDKTFTGTVLMTATRAQISGSTYAMLELHVPGTAASALTISSDNITRLSTSNGSGGTSLTLWSADSVGNFTATGNVTAYSDERLKTDWRDLPDDFVKRLARVKMGVYRRTDTQQIQVGVGAGSLRDEALPEAVHSDADGTLSVTYGNAALASCVALARELVALKQKLGV